MLPYSRFNTYADPIKKALFPVITVMNPTADTLCQALPGKVFDFPFFNDGVSKLGASRDPQVVLDVTKEETVDRAGALEISGFIFHTAHCGSTLMGRMLGVSKKQRLVSETEAINGFLLATIFQRIPESEVLRRLKVIIEAYRQPLGDEKYLFFKLTSWNVFFIDLFYKLYPDAPWIYIDRDTEDVVNSLERSRRGFVQWWDHPADVLWQHFLGPDLLPDTRRGYLQQMVEGHRAAALNFRKGQFKIARYPHFIQGFKEEVISHFGLHYSDSEVLAAMEMTNYDSKSFAKAPFQGSVSK